MDSGNANGSGGGSLSKYGTAVPMLLAQAIETLRAVGLDIPGMLNQEEAAPNGKEPQRAQVPASARTALDSLQADVDAPAPAPATSAPGPQDSGTGPAGA